MGWRSMASLLTFAMVASSQACGRTALEPASAASVASQSGGGIGTQSSSGSGGDGSGGRNPTTTGGSAGGAGTVGVDSFSGPFISVSTGSNGDAGCGVLADQTIGCWGDSRSTAPAGTFNSVSVGDPGICGVKTDGTIVCWGDNAAGLFPPPGGTFTFVSVGANDACAVETDGTVVCWGDGPHHSNPIPPSGGTFTSVSQGLEPASSLVCAMKTDGTLACTGGGNTAAPDGTFTSYSMGWPMACGVRPDGTVACFSLGDPTSSWCVEFEGASAGCVFPFPGGTYTSVSAGGAIACGVKTEGTIACWGLVDSSGVPAGTFTSVSVGGDGGVCAIRTNGSVVCWYYSLGH